MKNDSLKNQKHFIIFEDYYTCGLLVNRQVDRKLCQRADSPINS